MNQFIFGQLVSSSNALVFIAWIVIAICLFIILREFFCWYWKINKIVNLLEEIGDISKVTNTLLGSIRTKLSSLQVPAAPVGSEEVQNEVQ